MLSSNLVFVVAVAMTAASGIGTAALALLGDTRRNKGQRAVAVKLAQIAVIGASALVALLQAGN